MSFLKAKWLIAAAAVATAGLAWLLIAANTMSEFANQNAIYNEEFQQIHKRVDGLRVEIENVKPLELFDDVSNARAGWDSLVKYNVPNWTADDYPKICDSLGTLLMKTGDKYIAIAVQNPTTIHKLDSLYSQLLAVKTRYSSLKSKILAEQARYQDSVEYTESRILLETDPGKKKILEARLKDLNRILDAIAGWISIIDSAIEKMGQCLAEAKTYIDSLKYFLSRISSGGEVYRANGDYIKGRGINAQAFEGNLSPQELDDAANSLDASLDALDGLVAFIKTLNF